MLTPEQVEARLNRILLKVQKPGRYVGGELNQSVKPWDDVKTHVALIFPDLYDLGLANLGIAILIRPNQPARRCTGRTSLCPLDGYGNRNAQRRHPAVCVGEQAPDLGIRHHRDHVALRESVHQCSQPARSGRHSAACIGTQMTATRW